MTGSEVTITLPDGTQRSYPRPVTGQTVAESIGPGLAKAALAVKVDGELRDLAREIDGDAALEIVTSVSAPRALVISKMALLVLFSAPARAWLIAPDLPAGANERLNGRSGCCRLPRGLPARRWWWLSQCGRLIVFEFECLRASALCLHALHIFFTLNTYSGEHADRVVLHLLEHLAKHFEGFALVFLLRIFLSVTAQVNALAQVVHTGEMFLPVIVELPQHDFLLDLAHQRRADRRNFLIVSRLHFLDGPFADLVLVHPAVFAQPPGDVQRRQKFAGKRMGQALGIPLLLNAAWRYVLVDNAFDDFLANG